MKRQGSYIAAEIIAEMKREKEFKELAEKQKFIRLLMKKKKERKNYVN